MNVSVKSQMWLLAVVLDSEVLAIAEIINSGI